MTLQYLDERDYRLAVTVDHDGDVEIQHQDGDDTDALMAIASLAVDRVGRAAIERHRRTTGIVVTPPPAGQAMLACRCGAVLDAAQMRRLVPAGADPRSPVIRPIVCGQCAGRAR